MSDQSIQVLLLEDNPDDALLVSEILDQVQGGHFSVHSVDTVAGGLQRLSNGGIDIVLLDLSLPDSFGLDTFHKIHAQMPEVPVIVLSGLEDETLALQAVQEGAQDYLIKGNAVFHLLERSVRYAIERNRLFTEQRLRELQASEARLRDIIEKNADAIVIVDRNGTVCFANPGAESLFGRPRDSLLGDLFGFPPVVGETTELDVLRRGGKAIIVEMRMVEIQWEGEFAYLASLRDITERKQAEQTLARQNEELARSNKELEQFAYVASHDLKEPLRSVSNYVTLLEKRYKDKLDADAAEFIGFAVDGVKRMYTLINDLLLYSKVGARQRPLESTICDAVLSQVLHTLEADLKEADAVITRDPLPTVMADATQLSQLFQNLISNSIRFRSDQPSRIHVSAQKIERSGGASFKPQVSSVESRVSSLDPQVSRSEFRGPSSKSKVPENQNPGSEILKPETQNPKFETDFSQLETQNSKPETNSPQSDISDPETQDPELETHSPPSAIINPPSQIQNPESGEWLFSVRDNGIGIDPQYAERIFVIFQQLQGGAEYPGTGIGLAVCKKIVEHHGGHLWVESEPGKGATFYFTIPDRGGGLL